MLALGLALGLAAGRTGEEPVPEWCRPGETLPPCDRVNLRRV
jgi:hypothetical protein